MKFELSYPLELTDWDGKVISLKNEKDIIEKLEIMKKAGISWVMASGFQLEERSDFDIMNAAERMGRLIAGEGFKISSHHCLTVNFAPLDKSQQATRDKLAATVEIGKLLRANVLVTHPARIEGHHDVVETIFSGFEEEERKHGLDAVLDTLAENMQYFGDYAANASLDIAIENIGIFEPVGDINTLPVLLKKIDRTNVGCCLDSGHAHACGESVVSWIELLGNKLLTTHFHDNRARLAGKKDLPRFVVATKEYDEHRSPGFGTIPWLDVIAALNKIGYSRPVNFETGGWPDMDGANGYRHAIDWWRTCEKIVSEGKA